MTQRVSSPRTIEQKTLLLEIASREVMFLLPTASIALAAQIMAEKQISSVIVTDNQQRPISIVTENNILQAMQADFPTDTQLQKISLSPVTTVIDTISCFEAYQVFLQENVKHLVIIDRHHHLQGIVSETDFLIHLNLPILAGRQQVAWVMTRAVFTLPPNSCLEDLLAQMQANKEDCIVIVNHLHHPLGIITQRDIVRLYSDQTISRDRLVTEFMSSPIKSISLNASINEAAEKMLTYNIRHLVVIDSDGKLAGALTEHDLTNTLAQGIFKEQLRYELRNSEAHMRRTISLLNATLESSNDAFLVVDLFNNWVIHNQRFIDLWQIPEYIVSAKNDQQALSYVLDQVEDPDAFLQKIQQLYSRPESSAFDVVKFKNGKIIERTSIPQTIEGEVVGRVWIFRNVTERYQAEQALKSIAEKNLALLRNASDGIHIVNKQGRIIEVSDSFCSMLGYLREEMIGMHISDWDAVCSDNEINSKLNMQFTNQFRSQFETKHKCKSGFIFDVEVSGYPLMLDGEPVLFNSSRDITERKRSETLEQFRSHILELVSGGSQLLDILEQIVFGVENLSPGCLCSILLLNNEGRYFSDVVAPNLPDFYNKALENIAIGDGVGSCCTAAFTGKLVIVEDIANHPYWADYRQLASQAGLRACWSQPIMSSSGTVLGTFAIYHQTPHTPTPSDITLIQQSAKLACIAIERSLAEEKLQLAASVFTHAREGIMITELDGSIIAVNDAFTQITGYSRVEVLGKNPKILSSGYQKKEFYDELWGSLKQNGYWHGEVWNKRKNGEIYVEMLTISAVLDAKHIAKHYVALFYDITAQKEYERQLEHIAHYDALTNLPNRILFADRLYHSMKQTMRRKQKLAVIYLDLDGFKAINDNYGHDVGDQVLIAIANRMKLSLREGDTIARLGGDEFVVVLVDLIDIESSLLLISRLLTAAAQPLIVAHLQLHVSASLGISQGKRI